MKLDESTEVRVILLENKNLNDIVYRVTKGTILQFRLSAALHGHQVVLQVNHPTSLSEKFARQNYHIVEWILNKENEETYTNIQTISSGCFQFFCQKDGKKSGSGYFLVDPVLRAGKNNEVLPLDSVCCQTFFPKCLGPLKEWKGRLEVAHQSGYNMIHFSPIQELGASNSSYSISDQLALNPIFGKVGFDDVEKLVNEMKEEWGVLSICDVVLNHTANETPWLKTNPEAGYNLMNSLHLRPAYLLDSILEKFGTDIAQELYADRGLTSKINSEDHLNIIRVILKNELLPQAKIQEMFLVHVDDLVEEFNNVLGKLPKHEEVSSNELQIIQDPEYRRLKSSVDIHLAVQLHYIRRNGGNDKNGAIESFKNDLYRLNDDMTRLIISHLDSAVENVIAGTRYERLQHDGPLLPQVTKKNPLIQRYFVKIGLPPCSTLAEEEHLIYSPDSRFILAHNGWVMSDDPLQNFAEPGSNVYLRRELIAWGDSVKLRFGTDPSYCPFLWEIMKKYVEKTASLFHGLRLDNCHSTPINVAEYLLDSARNVRPDLYVVAELFTNSDRTDNIFVNRLGITSLIREAMSAGDSHEEGRLVYRYGGLPVGAFVQEPVRPLMPSIAHALLMDQTHDNPSPINKRSIYDILPTAALVSMASCASGSNRGLDELVPHHIDVVNESRFYSTWSDKENLGAGLVNKNTGILMAKKVINNLHAQLGKEGFNEVYVDQMDYDIVSVTRHNPSTNFRVVLVAYTAFSNPDYHFYRTGGIKDLIFEGIVDDVVFESQLKPVDRTRGNFPRPEGFVQEEKYINAVTGYECTLKENFPIEKSEFVRLEGSAIKFINFQPGSVIAFRIRPTSSVTDSISSLYKLVSKESLQKVINPLNFNDLNLVLYKCEEEERDFSGCGVYSIPHSGTFVYAGLQGIISVLADVRLRNDTGHPICNNLRAGDWLMEYTYGRLLRNDGTKELGELLKKCTECVHQAPRYLVPRLFDIIVRNVYLVSIEAAWNKMSKFIQDSSPFTKSLALGSLQCCGLSFSGPLPSLSPKLGQPNPKIKEINGKEVQDCGSLSAGLPHFSTGYMRNWGRDTFISLPGLLILTGRCVDARNHILAFASVLRHGLIPNLLDRGTNSRYNCRDATWFWLQAIKVYVESVPKGESILKDRVSRMWPNDFGDAVLDHSVEQSLEDVMHEALQRHFEGIDFRERNAGNRIDGHMQDEGFNVVAGVDLKTGFVYGGNSLNCGTWMDKMGSSEKAGIQGNPATPRDGSAVELVGLSASVVKFLAEMHTAGKYRYKSVEKTIDGKEISWTLLEWYEKIRTHFEEHFWIAENPSEKNDPHEDLINRRGIYKDSVGASALYYDYQLRPNFLVAMTVAPGLFTAERAIIALQKCRSVLLSELGIRTLDPSDWNYNGNYDNSNDSSDSKVAHGFNYHNGPEWLWPVGFYLRAYLKFSKMVNQKEEAVKHVRQVISKHWRYLQATSWKGLPELTNKDGAECWGSCRVQAWSMATILEVLRDLEDLDNKN